MKFSQNYLNWMSEMSNKKSPKKEKEKSKDKMSCSSVAMPKGMEVKKKK